MKKSAIPKQKKIKPSFNTPEPQKTIEGKRKTKMKISFLKSFNSFMNNFPIAANPVKERKQKNTL